MKFLIATPSFGRATYLNSTIESVVSQGGEFEIEYVVQDGGSGKDVLDILRGWQAKIEKGYFQPRCKQLTFKWFSEADQGMYDALNKAFSRNTADVMAWINTDDLFHPNAFETVRQVFCEFENVSWITGIPNSFNMHGSRCGFDTFPAAYSQEFIRRGYYDVAFLKYGFNWIPQDCCFWRCSLWEKIGAKLDDSKKAAADFYLWQEFAKHADLVKVHTFLGGYRFHGDQITANQSDYRTELPQRSIPPSGLLFLKWILKNMPFLREFFYNSKQGFPLINLLGLKWHDLVGRSIRWDYHSNKWVMDLRAII